jgi:hypothetical protein
MDACGCSSSGGSANHSGLQLLLRDYLADGSCALCSAVPARYWHTRYALKGLLKYLACGKMIFCIHLQRDRKRDTSNGAHETFVSCIPSSHSCLEDQKDCAKPLEATSILHSGGSKPFFLAFRYYSLIVCQ